MRMGMLVLTWMKSPVQKLIPLGLIIIFLFMNV